MKTIHQMAAAAAVALMLMSGTSHASLLSDWGLPANPYTTAGSFGTWNVAGHVTETGSTEVSGVQEHWAEGDDSSSANVNSHFTNGPSGGEDFDLEFLAWRVTGGQFQVLGITSINPDAGAVYNSYAYHIGDIFLNTDGNAGTGYNGYDAGIDSGDGSLHSVTGSADTVGIQGPNSYGPTGYPNTTVQGYANPYALSGSAGQLAGGSRIVETLTNLEGSKTNYAIQLSVDANAIRAILPDLGDGPTFQNLSLHWAVECGNDWLNTDPTGYNEPTVPEPATLGLIALGLGSMGTLRRRRRKA